MEKRVECKENGVVDASVQRSPMSQRAGARSWACSKKGMKRKEKMDGVSKRWRGRDLHRSSRLDGVDGEELPGG